MRNGDKNSHYKIQLRFVEDKYPLLLDISSLMYDLVLAHDFGVILTEEEYSDYKFGQYFWYRQGRPIKPYHRIRASRIIKVSPLILEVIVPSIGGGWVLLQIIEKIQNWSLNREKLKLEIEKLREEKQLRRKELEMLAERREAVQQRSNLIKRLNESPLVLEDVKINIIEIERKEKKQAQVG